MHRGGLSNITRMDTAMPTVVILGSDGMIGSGLLQALQDSEFTIYGSTRRANPEYKFFLDVQTPNFENVLDFLPSGSYLVNCIGLIRHKISQEREADAWYLNSEYPNRLANYALKYGQKLINICTDCIYSGKNGSYDENSPPDPTDIYGETKAAGEIKNPAVMNLRTSVIGPEVETAVELLSWVLSSEPNSTLSGFTNHLWNGVTSASLAKIVSGIIQNNSFEPGIIHLVPENKITKHDLIREIAIRGNRKDLTIMPFKTETSIDRTLSTVNQGRNRTFWKNAGYDNVPTIQHLLGEVLPLRNLG